MSMSTLHQKRQNFASVLEMACKQSSSLSSQPSPVSPVSPDLSSSLQSCYHGYWDSASQWYGSTPTTPQLEHSSLHQVGWSAVLLGAEASYSSQLSPCIDCDSWPSESTSPWALAKDVEFLEAETADHLLKDVLSNSQEMTQTSMDLLEFLDDESRHTVSQLGACMNMDDPLFTGSNKSPKLPAIPNFQLNPKQEDCIKSDVWLNDPVTSDSDLDDLLLRSASAHMPASCKARLSSASSPREYLEDLTKGWSTIDYLQSVSDKLRKKNPKLSKNMSEADLLFRKEKNRLRSKAYRLRRKMQFESMKKEVTQARQKIEEVEKQLGES